VEEGRRGDIRKLHNIIIYFSISYVSEIKIAAMKIKAGA